MELEQREKVSLLFDSYKELLSQSQKQVLHLYLIEDLTITDISEILATSRQAINDALKKGTRKLISINKKLNKKI